MRKRVLFLILICAGVAVPVLASETVEQCGFVENGQSMPMDEYCRTTSMQACDSARVALEYHRCAHCPSWQQVMAFRDSHSSEKDCMRASRKYQCANSPWKDKSVPERYKELLDDAREAMETKPSLKGLAPETLGCISARETTTLEPIAVNCDKKSSAFGLGQLLKGTLMDLVGIRSEPASRADPVSRAVCKGADWLMPYSCDYFQEARMTDPAFILDALAQDPRLQIRAMVEALGRHAEKDKVERVKDLPEKWRTLIEVYNGGPDKEQYARKVLECADCLRKGRSELSCLEIAAEREIPAGKLCGDAQL